MPMRLWQLRRHWDRFAQTDPFWAVLTTPDKQGNRWKIDEFFATGQAEVTAAMKQAQAHGQLARGRALDFGCGVGRLTQALTAHFDHVTGVDISAEMLGLAARYNRHVDRVSYVHNPKADLSLFPDNSFDFVLSMITLQHIAPAYSKGYIAEFLRVAVPGGIVYFQAPDRLSRPRRWKIPLYPPTVAKKVRRFVNKFVMWEPAMEMNVLPRAEVHETIREAGGQVLAVLPRDSAGSDFISYVYIARKPPVSDDLPGVAAALATRSA